MSTADIEQLFRPSSASVRQLLSDHIGGFAVPSYQRPYRWQPQDIKRLLEDLLNGLRRLRSDSNAVTFIGAIITLSDVSNGHNTRPREARQIIDGQQRLSTLLMLMVLLHKELGNHEYKVRASSENATDEEVKSALLWSLEQTAEMRKQLLSCLAEERGAGDDAFKHLPKLVRDIADAWSNRQESARYISPMAHLLHSYVTSSVTDQPFELRIPLTTLIPEPTGSSREDHETVHLRFNQLRRYIRQIGLGKERDLSESIEIDLLLSPSSVLTHLFDDSPAISAEMLEELSDDYSNFRMLLRLLALTRFILDRVAITRINAKDESYAFDLFDSLNTTGEPLTALETFHPLVVEAEGRDTYHQTASYQHISLTSNLIAEHEGTIQRETARLITSFLLADAGLKVPNRHNDQRRDLTQRYRLAPDLDAKRQMTMHLSDVALTYFRLWEKGELVQRLDGSPVRVDEDTGFCLDFLRRTNHSVTVAPFSRYFSAWRASPSEHSRDMVQKAIRAVTAFSVMWRAAHGGTDGIDAEYRSLMLNGVSEVMQPLARTPTDSHAVRELPSITSFVAALWKKASSHKIYGFSSREEWVERVYARPIYDEQPELARFLLLLASHHAVPDGHTGLTKPGAQADHTDMLRTDRWSDERLATIEHVAPQNPLVSETGRMLWSSEVYADPTIVHRIGNLALLPLDDNSALGNRTWHDKRYIYRALSAESPDEAKGVLSEAEAKGVEMSTELGERVLAERRHLPLLRALAFMDGEWNARFVNERSRHLVGRCWDVLSGWLPGE